MSMRVPEVEDSQLNMTPMIDIVFQLIVFFLLTLKFKSVDRRLEFLLPKEIGTQITHTLVPEVPSIPVKMFRQEMDDPDRAYTTIRVGNAATFDLPRGDWTGQADLDAARRERYDGTIAQVRSLVAGLWERMGGGAEVRGVIRTPLPKGLKVPHGDVVRVLDALLDVGLSDVKFEGARPPLPTAGGGGQVTLGGR